MKKKQLAVAALLAAGLVATSPVQADQGLGLTGVDASKQSLYVYAGLLFKLSGKLGESGPLLRAWGDRHRYEFGRGAGIVDADSNTGSLALGWQLMRPTGHFTAYLGGARRSTAHSPPFPNGETRQSDWGGLAQIELAQALGGFARIETIANYLTGADDYWVRGRLLFDVGQVYLGPEIGFQGNEDYDGWRAGLALADWKIVDQVSTSIAAGYEDRDRVEAGGYFNLGVAVPF